MFFLHNHVQNVFVRPTRAFFSESSRS